MTNPHSRGGVLLSMRIGAALARSGEDVHVWADSPGLPRGGTDTRNVAIFTPFGTTALKPSCRITVLVLVPVLAARLTLGHEAHRCVRGRWR